MTTIHFPFTIIGAGVIGLSICRELSQIYGEQVLVIEKEHKPGMGVSSRNSEVIHSGIYYPTGTLKQLLCVQGRRLLYQYCLDREISFNACGKIIFITEENEQLRLEQLFNQAKKNGIEAVERLSDSQIKELEPELCVKKGLYVKKAGVLDTHGLITSLLGEIKSNKATLVFDSEITDIQYFNQHYELVMADGTKFQSDWVINCAGLYSDKIAQMLSMEVPIIYPCKGTYFSYQGPIKINHLLYPLPSPNLQGLGTHLTIDLQNRIKIGPDNEYITDKEDFKIEEGKVHYFYQRLKSLFPLVTIEQLQPDTVGIRPKIQPPNSNTIYDFYIQEESKLGFPGFINCIGIESPGLTASLAIGKYVCSMVQNKKNRSSL